MEDLKKRVVEALEQIRPYLQADGGDIELIDVSDDGKVKVRLTGSCGGCPFAQMTLKNGVESVLKRMVPDVKEVVAV